jgi:hypothetical protein
MSLRRVVYFLLIVVIAGASALVGAAAGGFAVYRAVQGQPIVCPLRFRRFYRPIILIPVKH